MDGQAIAPQSAEDLRRTGEGRCPVSVGGFRLPPERRNWRPWLVSQLPLVLLCNTSGILVVPAKAGTQKTHWIPACAGMTRGQW